MGAATDLYDLCKEYLGACVEAVALSPGGPIDRAFVAPGNPAWDCCPQLTVHAGGPAIADTAPLSPPLQPGHRIADVGAVHLVTMTATVIRCSPGVGENGELPTAAELDATSQETLGDLWSIWNHVATLKREGLIFAAPDGNAKTREMFFDPAVALGTQGGCSGWQVQIRVQLGGYRSEATP